MKNLMKTHPSVKFIKAIRENDIDQVKLMIENGVDVNGRSVDEWVMPLIVAVTEAMKTKNYEIVDLLLTAGVDVKTGKEALELAVLKGDEPLAIHLIIKGVVPNEYIKRNTYMTYAIQKGLLELVKELLKHKFTIKGWRYDEETNEEHPIEIPLIEKEDLEEMSPILQAIDVGNTDIIRILVGAGVELNEEATERGDIPLLYAIRFGKNNVIETLLSLGADPDFPNDGAALKEAESAHNIAAKAILEKYIGGVLSPINAPANAPKQCFDPLMASESNINMEENAVFYIQDSFGKTTSAGCLDEDTLKAYKTGKQYVFYKCKNSVPVSALQITRNSVLPTKYRLLNFAMRIYVKDSEAQQLKVGERYVLKPVELIGRLASKSVVDGGSVVSALHCGPADGTYLYSIHKVSAAAAVGGRTQKRRTVRHRRARRQTRKTK